MLEHTLAIIKPDAVSRQQTGQIIMRIEASALYIVAIKMAHLTLAQTQEFYAMHRESDFFEELCTYMTTAPIIAAVLAGDEAIRVYRELMGATDPAQAIPGTLRADFGQSIQSNAVHGSDTADNAAREIAIFFSHLELYDSYSSPKS